MRFLIVMIALFLLTTPLVFPHTPLPAISETREVTIPLVEEEPVPTEEDQKEVVIKKEEPAPPTKQKVTPPPSPTKPVSAKTESASTQNENLAAILEEKIWAFTNNERARRNLGTLTKDAVLAETSRSHSRDMLARDFFEHENPDGCSSSCRATEAGYAWRSIGENLYMLEGFEFSPDETAAMIVSGWMESPGHRANILREGYTETGVGVIVEGRAIYATVLYATPR